MDNGYYKRNWLSAAGFRGSCRERGVIQMSPLRKLALVIPALEKSAYRTQAALRFFPVNSIWRESRQAY
jgi:hypothetical protein